MPSSLSISQNRRDEGGHQLDHPSQPDQRGRIRLYPVHVGQTDSYDGLAWTNQQGWQGLQNLFYDGIPEMDFNNIQSLNADRLTSLTKSFTYEYDDVLMWVKGNHTLKFGTDVQTLEAVTPLGFNGSDNYGTYTFNTSGSKGLFTGVDFADFLLGLPNETFYDVVGRTTTAFPFTTTSTARTSGTSIRG